MSKPEAITEPTLAIDFEGRHTLFYLPGEHTDHVQNYLATQQEFYELGMLRHLRSRLDAGALMVDVGAYIGTHTLFVSHICGGEVVAFEPNPEAYRILQINVGLNGLSERVQLVCAAVGERTGRGELVRPPETNVGQTSIVESDRGPVEIVRLDDQQFDQRVSILKVDVEGHELAVLRGARELIERDRPTLYVECATQESLSAVVDLLLKWGYSVGPCFNATPTIAFLPEPSSPATVSAQAAQLQHGQQRRFERLHGDLRRIEHMVTEMGRSEATDRSKLSRRLRKVEQLLSRQGADLLQAADQYKCSLVEIEKALVDTRGLLTRTLQDHRATQRALLSQHSAEMEALRRKDLRHLNKQTHRAQEELRALRSELGSLRSILRRLDSLERKRRKLRRNPEKFFADSANPVLKGPIRSTVGGVQRAIERTGQSVRKLIKLKKRPRAFFGDSKSSIVKGVGRIMIPVLERYAPASTPAPQPAPKPAKGSHKKARKKRLDIERSLDLVELSVVAVFDRVDEAAVQALAELSTKLKHWDEIVLVVPAPHQVDDLQQLVGGIRCARLTVYLRYDPFDEHVYSGYGLDRAHGKRVCLWLSPAVETAPPLAEAVLSEGRVAHLFSSIDGDLLAVCAPRDALREHRWLIDGRLAPVAALERSAQHFEAIRQHVTPGRRRRFADSSSAAPNRQFRVVFQQTYQPARTAEKLLVFPAGQRFHVYAFDPALLPEEIRQWATTTVLDLRQLPDFWAFPMPSSSDPFGPAAETDVVCLWKRPIWARTPDPTGPRHKHRVSVIMTAYNAERTIVAAARSILEQTHSNLELIVVDDCSTDRTLEAANRLAQHDRRMRVVRCPENRGTYWAKNYGLTLATGKFVTFHDSDDISLAPRLELELSLLAAMPKLVGASVYYQRITAEGEVRWVGAYKDRLSRICLMLRRSVIREIGYFDSVRVSADDEYLGRLRAAKMPVARLPMTLHFAESSNSSLTTSGVDAIKEVQGGAAQLSPNRTAYFEAAQRWHEEHRGKLDRLFIQFPERERPFPVPDAIRAQRGTEEPFVVTASLATMPSRTAVLERSLATILPQVDRLNVYLNNFENVPEFLHHPKITLARSQDHGDLRDNGKFFFARSVEHGYHFTIDDDIEYPPDYVRNSILAIERYHRRAVVGTHGVNLANPLRRYLSEREVFPFQNAQGSDRFVQLLGTGTVAYHTSTLKVGLEDFGTTGVADLWFAACARDQNVPLVSQRRGAAWMKPVAHDGETIFEATRLDDSEQTKLAKRLGPWDEEVFELVRRPLLETIQGSLDFPTLAATGYDIHALARAQGLPPVRLVLVVPGWNCEEHVAACWKSIVGQQPGHYHLSVWMIDDGSTDETQQAIRRVMTHRPLPTRYEARLLTSERNMGPAFSRWRAIQEVSDPDAVLVFLDMDDALLAGALARVAEAYLTNPKCLMTIGNWKNQKGRPNPLDAYPEEVVRARAYRRMNEFRIGHLRTFRRRLADSLTDADFKGPDGSWLMYCTDVALFFPLLECCDEHSVTWIRDPLYQYNERRQTGTLARFGKDKKRAVYTWIAQKSSTPPIHGGVGSTE